MSPASASRGPAVLVSFLHGTPKLAELQHAVSTLETKLAEQAKEVALLRHRAADTDATAAAATAEIVAMDCKAPGLTEQAQHLKTRLEAATEALVAEKATYSKEKKEFAHLRLSLEACVNDLQNRIHELPEQRHLDDQQKVLDSQLYLLNALNQERDDLTKRAATLHKTATTVKREKHQLQLELRSLHQRHDAASRTEQHRRQAQTLRERNETLRQEIKALEMELGPLQAAAAQPHKPIRSLTHPKISFCTPADSPGKILCHAHRPFECQTESQRVTSAAPNPEIHPSFNLPPFTFPCPPHEVRFWRRSPVPQHASNSAPPPIPTNATPLGIYTGICRPGESHSDIRPSACTTSTPCETKNATATAAPHHVHWPEQNEVDDLDFSEFDKDTAPTEAFRAFEQYRFSAEEHPKQRPFLSRQARKREVQQQRKRARTAASGKGQAATKRHQSVTVSQKQSLSSRCSVPEGQARITSFMFPKNNT
uniref:Uncharacterized protein n=1 Tax=Toxoplasma gondii COUG TaxID=1074873 RepID=A0A2G8Y1V4_TOXGO|nr:hypothetical protein TGCOUG_271080 [Toxoplasma gondii COUG]